MTGVVAGPDGRLRCPWATSTPEYVRYHDEEWGRPVRTMNGLYERITLEAFQSGLSWLTILRKRDNFRRAFAGFDPAAVAAFGPDDVQRLMNDPGIIRNRAKIDAAIANAAIAAELGDEFVNLIWSFAEPARPRPDDSAQVPASTPASKALSVALKARGFRFYGPTTAYATMQAAGLVDDHLAACETGP